MPELPEVETIRLGLEKYVVGHSITDANVRLKKIISGEVENIINATITGVRRFGKGLVIDLDNLYSIAVHIKLTGQLIYSGKDVVPKNLHRIKVIRNLYSELPNKWTHVVFTLSTKKGLEEYLYYNDYRQFGWIKIIESSKLKDLSFFKDLGPEFFKSLNLQTFRNIVQSSKLAIKPVLMDQKKMSGLGNIYANDGLNLARIDPRRKASSLSDKEIQTLYHSLETVLKRGLKYGGASELSYVNALGEEGQYQNHFLTYAREGQKCFNCGSTIEKIKLAGRGTYFCPQCQSTRLLPYI